MGAATFGGVFLVMRPNKPDPQPAAQPAVAKRADTPNVPPQQEMPKTEDTAKEEPVKKDLPLPIKKDPTPTFAKAEFRSWKVPAPDNLSGLEKGTFDVKDVTVSDDGKHVLVKSKREVTCLNVVTGQVTQTFRPAKPRWDYQKPETNFMFLSPDASCVIVGSESLSADKKTEIKEVTAYGATSGKVLGKGSLDERSGMHGFADAAVFTPNGTYLLLPTFHYRDGVLIQAVASSSGAVRMIDFPVKKDTGRSWELTLAVPQEPATLLVHRRSGGKTNPGGVTALDLKSGTEKPVLSLTVDPWNLFNRGVQISSDGNLLMSQGLQVLQVCDWRADKRLLELKIHQMSNARFTPDGKRLIVQWLPQYQVVFIGGTKGKDIQNVRSRLELYDIASQNKIGEFTPEKHGLSKQIGGLAVSRDGKTLVWGSETSVIAIDFKEAFGVDPLPSPSRPKEPDALPLK